MTRPLASAFAARIESLKALDPIASTIGKSVRSSIPAGPVKNALSGTAMGHALHPLLTDIPIGTWTSSLLLDLLGEERGADRLIAAGLVATPATLATGWSDWADTEMGDPGVRRTGLVHAAVNGGAVTLMAASLVARARGDRGRGKLLSLAGLSLLGGGGWLGGHLSYAQGVGVDQTIFDPGNEEWTAVQDLSANDLVDGRAACGVAGETPVMLYRTNGTIRALHNRCAHRGGPLSDGPIDGDTVTCPWHNTVFSLEDGSVVDGPSAYPQPVFDVRESGGRIEVRRRAH